MNATADIYYTSRGEEMNTEWKSLNTNANKSLNSKTHDMPTQQANLIKPMHIAATIKGFASNPRT